MKQGILIDEDYLRSKGGKDNAFGVYFDIGAFRLRCYRRGEMGLEMNGELIRFWEICDRSIFDGYLELLQK